MPITIQRIQHVGIPVSTLQASVTFYTRLGFHPCMESTFPHNGNTGQVVMMQHGEVVLELYQLPEGERDSILNRKDGHIDHLAFDVDNIEEAFQRLREEGFTPLESEPVSLPFWEKGCKFFHIQGPDGERLEFNQIL